MNIDLNPDYQKFAQKVIDKTGQGPRIGCAPFGRCNTGIDLLNTFLPSTVLVVHATPCPSYLSYLDQSVTTVGDNNVVTPTLIANETKPTTPEPTPEPPASTQKNTLVYILILIIAVFLGYFMMQDSEPDYAVSQMQPYVQPYMQQTQYTQF